MKRRTDGAGGQDDDEAALAARDDWLTQQLGEGWRAEGDGIYRFVGEADEPPAPPESTPSDFTEDVGDTHAPITREERHETEHRPHLPRLPWRPRRR
jgi:hypothetical protein